MFERLGASMNSLSCRRMAIGGTFQVHNGLFGVQVGMWPSIGAAADE